MQSLWKWFSGSAAALGSLRNCTGWVAMWPMNSCRLMRNAILVTSVGVWLWIWLQILACNAVAAFAFNSHFFAASSCMRAYTLTSTLSLQHFHFNTLTSIITSTHSLQHIPCNTLTSTLSLQHSHFDTFTSTHSFQHVDFIACVSVCQGVQTSSFLWHHVHQIASCMSFIIHAAHYFKHAHVTIHAHLDDLYGISDTTYKMVQDWSDLPSTLLWETEAQHQLATFSFGSCFNAVHCSPIYRGWLYVLSFTFVDVKKLIPEGLVDESTLLGIYRAYNVEEFCTVENEGWVV